LYASVLYRKTIWPISKVEEKRETFLRENSEDPEKEKRIFLLLFLRLPIQKRGKFSQRKLITKLEKEKNER